MGAHPGNPRTWKADPGGSIVHVQPWHQIQVEAILGSVRDCLQNIKQSKTPYSSVSNETWLVFCCRYKTVRFRIYLFKYFLYIQIF